MKDIFELEESIGKQVTLWVGDSYTKGTLTRITDTAYTLSNVEIEDGTEADEAIVPKKLVERVYV